MSPTMHVVTDAEAELAAKRARALQMFEGRYAHNPLTQRTMLGALRRIARTYSDGRCDEETFPWEMLLDIADIEEMRTLVVSKYARATASRDMSALRVMLHCGWKAKLITHGQLKELQDFQRVKGVRSGAGRYLDADHVERLLRDCLADPNEVKGLRDAAVITSLVTTGVRRHELVSVEMSQVDLDRGGIDLVTTKGGEPRRAFLNDAAAATLGEWLTVRGTEGTALFTPVTRSGRLITGRALSDHQVWKMVRARAAAAGLPEGTSTHDMRRFTVTHLLENGVDLLLVMKIVGHRHPSTTAKYDRRDETRCRTAVETLNIPSFDSLRASTESAA